MALFKPVEQLTAEALTVAAIRIKATSNANIVARSQMAQKVAGVFQTASTGDISGALSQLQTLILTPDLDPGIAQVLQDLLGIGNTLVTADAVVADEIPVFGDTLEAVFINIAAGMNSIASSYISKYGTPAPTPTAAAASAAAAPAKAA